MLDFDGSLLAILVLAAGAWAWHANLKIRERATLLAKQVCQRDGLQFLEGTVALQRLRPCRDTAGRLAWRRSYVFDYSDDGMRRQQGFVIFAGQRLECVGLASEDSPPAHAD